MALLQARSSGQGGPCFPFGSRLVCQPRSAPRQQAEKPRPAPVRRIRVGLRQRDQASAALADRAPRVLPPPGAMGGQPGFHVTPPVRRPDDGARGTRHRSRRARRPSRRQVALTRSTQLSPQDQAHPTPGLPQRIGLFGYLGSGNLGNDASMESALRYLRSAHPDAIIDAMCTGPDRLRHQYGLDAIPLFWYLKHERRFPGAAAIAIKGLGKIVDIVRIATWVRSHDVVIVPGMGVLETTLPLRALGAPYAMFLLCLSGRLSKTKVALVSVGANVIKQPLIRWLYRSAAW